MNISPLQQRDLNHFWHPCAQMKDYETFLPMEVQSAKGSWIHLKDGRRLIDAISSWWCKSLGHGHPVIGQALKAQVDQFEHVILANTTNENIVALCEKLAGLTRTLDRVSFASDGSCAVEMAIKMSVHARMIKGQRARTQILSFANGYHGETCATLAVSDLGLYRDGYAPLLPQIEHFLQDVPYVSGPSDPLWHDCSAYWPKIEAQLEPLAEQLTAIVFEPVIQGAGGMILYSPDLLRRLRTWADQHDIHLIADEIMTGFGRCGEMLACEYAGIEPDFVCVSKGLTAGWLPLSAMLTSSDMYALFYDDYETGKAFMHSHTHTGNALGVAVALAVMEVMEQEQTLTYVQQQLAPQMQQSMQYVAEETGGLTNIRGVGGMVAADLVVPTPGRWGYLVYQRAVELGALLRPLGNTLYWMPPLNTPLEVVDQLRDITIQSIQEVLKTPPR